MYTPESSVAFDALAPDYDTHFTQTQIGLLMRQAVWQRLAVNFQAGQRVLEINCGTGEDAVYLGQRGVQVLATDISSEMVALARLKVSQAGLTNTIAVRQLAVEELQTLEAGAFDGVLSNFGGLNCVADLAGVGHALATRLKPGASALFCLMGPLVPWEWGWFLCHGSRERAFRRLRAGGVVWRGLTIRYPSIARLQRAFSPSFERQRVSAICALLPPPYTEDWIARYPRLLACLNRWERQFETIPPLPWLADHYLLELRRR